jgi:hypothetical protein
MLETLTNLIVTKIMFTSVIIWKKELLNQVGLCLHGAVASS